MSHDKKYFHPQAAANVRPDVLNGPVGIDPEEILRLAEGRVSEYVLSELRAWLAVPLAEHYAHCLTATLQLVARCSLYQMKDWMLPNEFAVLTELADRRLTRLHVLVEELLAVQDRCVLVQQTKGIFQRLRREFRS